MLTVPEEERMKSTLRNTWALYGFVALLQLPFTAFYSVRLLRFPKQNAHMRKWLLAFPMVSLPWGYYANK